MIRMYKSLLTIILIFSVLAITGCTSSIWDRRPPPGPAATAAIVGAAGGAVIGSLTISAPLGAAFGSIWGGVFGAIIECHRTLVENLLYNGVQIIRVGDDIKIVLPSDRFFYPDSANLNPNYMPVLNEVALLLKSFDKITIKVTGYTGDAGDWRRNLALSRLQARTIYNLMTCAGVDARLIYFVGCGTNMPIATNATAFGQAMNRRVEITLRRLEFEPLV